nr:acyl CoA:acetate/3-ketoacid CoA transferase [Desulfobacterales bacterium]
TMDARIFAPEPMGVREDIMSLRLEDRFIYDLQEDLFFVNLEGHSIKHPQDIDLIESTVSRVLEPLGKKINAIINYDNFVIDPDLVDIYTDMVKRLVDRFYLEVTRYTTSTFLRMKLGNALAQRDVAPHIYESHDEAREALKSP